MKTTTTKIHKKMWLHKKSVPYKLLHTHTHTHNKPCTVYTQDNALKVVDGSIVVLSCELYDFIFQTVYVAARGCTQCYQCDCE